MSFGYAMTGRWVPGEPVVVQGDLLADLADGDDAATIVGGLWATVHCCATDGWVTVDVAEWNLRIDVPPELVVAP